MADSTYKYVAVNGYGWSGSGAYVDLLKEFEGYWECDGEVRIIRDPYGICDLEHALIDSWELLNCDIALRDFEWLAYRLYKKSSRFGGTGCSYVDKFGEGFWDETQKYIDRLSKWDFQGHWWWFEFKQSDFRMMMNRILKRLHIHNFEDDSRVRVVDISENEFLEATREYINQIYYSGCQKQSKENINTIILDQPFSCTQMEKAKRYFDDLKIIFVDRDPRDNYIDLINRKVLIGRELAKTHDAYRYVEWYKKTRSVTKKLEKTSDIIYLRFEDLILDYKNTVNKIFGFLGEDKSIHTSPFKYLKPEISSKNIGMWKQYPNQDEIRIIEKELLCE